MKGRCPAGLSQRAEERVAQIQKEIRDKQVAEAARTLQLLEEMKRKRQQALERLRQRQKARADALQLVERARRIWQAERFSEAKPLLEKARGLLGGLEADDPEVKRAAQDLEAMLAQVDARIAAQAKRKADLATLNEMFARIRKLQDSDLLEAEKKLLEAEQFARRANLPLTADQRQVAQQLRQAVEAAYGEQRRRRAERYWELVERCDAYIQAGQWECAQSLLRAVQQAEDLHLNEERSQALAARLRELNKLLTPRREAMKRVKSLTAEAHKRLQRNDGEGALACYQQALAAAQRAGIPPGQLGELLSAYEHAAASVLPRVVETQVARFKQVADAAVKEALTNQAYWEARAYVEHGSWDAAAPLLKTAAEQAGLDAEKREWARQQLEGIEGKTTALRDAELLATRDLADAVYALERQFAELLKAADLAQAEQLNARIEEARLALLGARARLALRRGAYPVADELLRQNEALVSAHEGAEALQGVLEPVERWRRLRSLVSGATEALRKGDVEALARALAGMEGIELPANPLSRTILALRQARNALVQLQAQRSSLLKKQQEALQGIHFRLVQDEARRRAWEAYLHASLLYADGKWLQACKALRALSDMGAALLPFEAEQARLMLAKAEGELEAQTRAARTAEAQEMLKEVEAKIRARRFTHAANMLDTIERHPIYGRYEGVRQQVAALRARIQAAEQEAARLYEEAAQAYEKQDHETLKRLLDELRTRYQHTRTYARHQH